MNAFTSSGAVIAASFLSASAIFGCGGHFDDSESKPAQRVLPSSSGTGGAPALVDAGYQVATNPDAGGEALLGVWVGQIEHAITARDDTGPAAPPQHVVMVVVQASGTLAGSIVFGDAPPFPTATDPNAFYPPITPLGPPEAREGELFDLVRNPFDGQPYSFFYVNHTDTRLMFEVVPAELWKDWCAMQPKTYPSRRLPSQPWVCAVHSTLQSNPEFDQDALCNGNGDAKSPCVCDEKSCHADTMNPNDWNVDLALQGESLEGLAYSYGSAGGIWSHGMKLRRISQ
jgi:hypothetical protein